jgi:glycosyltransferase involved in cell wall biosynthesis
MSVKKLLMIADFACHTGFSTVAENVACRFVGWDVSVLAVNFKGDPSPLQGRFALYPAWLGGDPMGVGRLPFLVRHIQPDAILAINDPWIVKHYVEVLAELGIVPPIVAYMPVDGTSLRPADVEPLNALAHAIAYTRFGLSELRRAGLDTDASIIPHGVDLATFHPLDQAETRARFGLPVDMFAVLVLDQNQVRKRLDIAFDAFARFAADCGNARLIYHGPLNAEQGWDILAMAADLGIAERLILTGRKITQTTGLRIEDMAAVYALADVKLTTTAGEGWGLTTMEAMACGVPSIVPGFGALVEWASPAVACVQAPIPVRHAGGINTVGQVPLAEDVALALHQLASNGQELGHYRRKGLNLVGCDCYRWETIADQFNQVLTQVTT